MNRQSKQSTDLRAQFLKRSFLTIGIMGLFILAGFSIFNYTSGRMTEMWINVAFLLLVAVAILTLRFNIKGVGVYRIICVGTGVGLYSLVLLGPRASYFLLVLPLVMFFFLGPREGMIWSTCFLFGVTALLFASEFLGSQAYPTEQAVRLLCCFLFVMFFGWNQATSHERFSSILMTKNEQLQDEQKQLKDALDRVRTTESRLEQINVKLREKTRLMETVFDNMDEGIVVVDVTGRQLLYNPSAKRISGKGMTTSQASQWAEIYGLYYPDQETLVPVDQNPLVRAMRGESVDGFEAFVRNEKRPEGGHVSGDARPLRSDENGEVEAAVLIFRDITRHKQTEERLEQTITELRDRTQLMETVFDSMSEGVVVGDPTGHLLFFNPSAERIMGMGAMDTPTDRWAETYGIFYPDGESTVPFDELPLARSLRGEATDGFEAFVRNAKRPDGVHVSGTGRPIRNRETDEVEAGVVVFRDITRQKETEARLEKTINEMRDQSQLMEAMFNSVSDGVVVTDTQGGFLFVNPIAEHIVGMGATEGPANQWSETYGTFYPDGKSLFPSDELPLAHAMRGESVNDVELLIRNQERPEGVYISVNARPLRDDAGALQGGMIVLRDITKLKETETELKQTVASLREQSQLMEIVFNSISDGVMAADENGEYLVFNSSVKRITGISPETKLSQLPEKYGLFLPDRKTPFPVDKLPLRNAIRGESTDGIDMFICNQEKPEGVYVSVSGRPLRDDSGATKGGVITFRDVTAIKEAESRLQLTAKRLQTQTHAMETIFNSISDGVVAADENGNFTIFNPSAERIVGFGNTETSPDEWSDLYGIFYPDRVTPVPTEELPLVLALNGRPSDEMEMFIRNPRVPDGVYISVSGRPLRDDSGQAKGGVIVFRDVTARMLAEEALTQAFAHGRLEVVDTILHNIGNAINSVTIGVGTLREQMSQNELARRFEALAKAVEAHRDDWIPYLQSDPQGRQVLPFILALAKDFTEEKARMKKTLDRVENRVAHIVDIVRTQKSFESAAMSRKDINLHKAVTDAVKLLQDSLAKRDIQIEIDVKHAPKEIRIQESKFHQMLVNLIKNSVEAIDDLAASNGRKGRSCIKIRSYVQGEFLVLEVMDNGIGMEGNISKIIFSAGYTTKKTGSGLGLHSTANFVIGSGGQIQPFSDGIGKGTTMRVKLRLSSVLPQTNHETRKLRNASPPPDADS